MRFENPPTNPPAQPLLFDPEAPGDQETEQRSITQLSLAELQEQIVPLSRWWIDGPEHAWSSSEFDMELTNKRGSLEREYESIRAAALAQPDPEALRALEERLTTWKQELMRFYDNGVTGPIILRGYNFNAEEERPKIAAFIDSIKI